MSEEGELKGKLRGDGDGIVWVWEWVWEEGWERKGGRGRALGLFVVMGWYCEFCMRNDRVSGW